jgi:hypothetical protein
MVNLQNSLSTVIGGVVAYLPRHLPPAKVESPGFARLYAVPSKWGKFATVLPFRPSRQIFVTGFFLPPVLLILQGKFLNWVIPDRHGRET